jgi:hypothetical protein
LHGKIHQLHLRYGETMHHSVGNPPSEYDCLPSKQHHSVPYMFIDSRSHRILQLGKRGGDSYIHDTATASHSCVYIRIKHDMHNRQQSNRSKSQVLIFFSSSPTLAFLDVHGILPMTRLVNSIIGGLNHI